ncbi:hypothetical protein BEN47_09505 [Hymenobacter lapidarius]|uniref:Uncharacterized protein n=1 Tax=Hymenobacter lapidarius TaxID=1908237 RepID=A0A1G1TB52_9BACT|nr:hypothetical protein BEN47_09505 [Hymenobacter lapidarius]
MQTLTLFLLSIWFTHTFALVIYNKYRVKQLIKYISLSRGRELSEHEFLELLDNYTSFLGYSSFSPSKKYYPRLYTNQEFAAFANRSKSTMIYLFSALAVGIIGSVVVDSLQR